MAITRINAEIRREIIKNCSHKTFFKKLESLQKRVRAVCNDIYDSKVSGEDERNVGKLLPCFMPKTGESISLSNDIRRAAKGNNDFKLNDYGFCRLKSGKTIYYNQYDEFYVDNVSDELLCRLKKLNNQACKIYTNRRKLESEIDQLVSSTSSVKQLREIWGEVDNYYDFKSPHPNAPMKLAKNITSMIQEFTTESED